MGHVLGHKSPKGAVSITNYKERIRLRWRYLGKRYSLNLTSYNKVNLKAANKGVLQIELDTANPVSVPVYKFDFNDKIIKS
jgi:integrase